jgi:UDP-N-acetylmuramoyl-L-alanyl-D-glutamate--2,6-diaminopimelate ligase
LKKLTDILKGVEIIITLGLTDIEINSLQFDSRNVNDGDLFIAIKGTQVDGHSYIEKAIQSGSKVVICEILPEQKKGITYVQVNNSSEALGITASNFYHFPSSKLKLVGITGTNGKTTIASLLYELFQNLGYPSGLLSTIQNKIDNKVFSATHTTPDPVQINELLNQMVNEGCEYCFMEVSSHAIDQDHINFDNYLKAKKKFFDELPAKAFALTNTDDKNGKIMLQNTRAKRKSYSLKSASDFKCKIIENHFDGLLLNIDGQEFCSNLIGNFNASNLLAVYATAVLLGEKPSEVLTALSNLKTVEGRFDYIRSGNNIVGIVDYAHSPDALKNVLDTIDSIRTYNETLITVFGAGGDRDKQKRPLMGKVVSEKSDKVILTSDNPRSEAPEEIIKDIEKGIEPQYSKRVISITNRKEAIKTACSFARNGDIILVAGKGHEKYQEIKGIKHPFDDKEILKNYLLTNINTN